MTDDLDDRLGRHLHQRAATIELTPGSVPRVARRAQQRRARRRVGGLAVVAVAGILVADRLTDVTNDDANVTVASPGSGLQQGAALAWQRQDPDPTAALGYAKRLVRASTGELYAVSTAPGRAGDGPVVQALYRSTDGVSWTPVSSGGPWLGDLDGDQGRLYALSTSPGTTDDSIATLDVRSSDDQGATWAAQQLPVDLATLGEQSENLWLGSLDLATTEHAVVATVTIGAQVDPAAFGLEAPYGLGATDDGVEVYGAPGADDLLASDMCEGGTVVRLNDEDLARLPRRDERALAAKRAEDPTVDTVAPGASGAPVPQSSDGTVAGDVFGCQWDGDDVSVLAPGDVHGPVVQTRSWDDLGAGPDLRLAAEHRLRAFVSADGGEFAEVALPAEAASGASSLAIEATADGFVLVVQDGDGGSGQARLSTFTSADGTTWTPAGTTALDGWVVGLGRIGDQLTAVVSGHQGGVELLTRVGDGWVSADLDGVLGELPAGAIVSGGSVAFGPAGMAVQVTVSQENKEQMSQYVLTSPDGITWTSTNLAEVPDSPLASSPNGYYGVRHMSVTDTGVVLTFDLPHDPADTALAPTVVLVGSF